MERKPATQSHIFCRCIVIACQMDLNYSFQPVNIKNPGQIKYNSFYLPPFFSDNILNYLLDVDLHRLTS